MAKEKTEKKSEKENNYFIQISDPIEMRRGILESSKSVLKCMQSYERLNGIRQKKLESIKKLHSIMRETGILVNKLKKNLPKNKFAPLPPRLATKVVRKPTGDEMHVLEKELNDIEKTLSDLS